MNNLVAFTIGMRHSSLAVTLVAALLAAASPLARAQEIAPLTSVDLDARLVAAGFDDAQRTLVLRDHASYVERFTAVVEARLAEWRGLTCAFPATIEDARTLVSKGRAAGQAIDGAEAPLLDQIRLAARADQAHALQELLTLLEIRRDLTLADSIREGYFTLHQIDVRDAIVAVRLPQEVLTAVSPQLDQYLLERRIAVRRCRDATLNAPLRRAEARINNPSPTRPPMPVDESDRAKWAVEYIGLIQSQQRTMMLEANAERIAARAQCVELDVRTLGALLPLLRGHDQAHLLSRWWSGGGAPIATSNRGPSALARAWKTQSNTVTAEVAAEIDTICSNWVNEWWPPTRDLVVRASRQQGWLTIQSFDAVESTKSDQRIADATGRAAAAISLALDGKVVAPTTTNAGAMAGNDRRASLSNFVAVGELYTMTASEIARGEMSIEGDTVELDGETVYSDIKFDSESTEPSKFTALPRRIQFDDIKSALEASGVDEVMMSVARTAIDDLVADGETIVQEADAFEATASVRLVMGGLFEHTADGLYEPVDLPRRARYFADRDQFRVRMLELEIVRLNEILAAVVPEAGRPCVSWIVPWRQFISEQAGSAGGDPYFSPMRAALDPTRAVRIAQFSPQDWRAVGPALASMCADLSATLRSVALAKCKARDAMPAPALKVSSGLCESPIDIAAAVKYTELDLQSQRIQRIARRAILDSIQRLKPTLSPDAAQRLQDAWDDQVFGRDLWDATSLVTRFEVALSLTLPDPIRGQVVALQSSWTAQSRTCRDRIVKLRSSAKSEAKTQEEATRLTTEATERKAKLAAIGFERDEMNRRVFRELAALLGSELASKLPALPDVKASSGGASATLVTPPAAP